MSVVPFGARVAAGRAATLLAILLLGLGCRSAAEIAPVPEAPLRWYKGNTHAHTLWDNGDALPELAADWYKRRGYDFVVLSDHNEHNALLEAERWVEIAPAAPGGVSSATLEDLVRRFGASWPLVREAGGKRELRLRTFSELEKEFRKDPRFLLIRGEEIGDSFQGKMIHHNALNIESVLLPPGGASVREVLQRGVRAVESQACSTGHRTLIHLNHLNLGWAVAAEDLIAVTSERFFEVYNGHPLARNAGDGAHPSTEVLWDRVLTARLRSGKQALLYGLAADDAHHYFSKGDARPGRGWIMVRAPELTADALLRAMDEGDFYSSTGILLSDVSRGECGLSVKVAPEPGIHYRIRFIGSRAGKADAGIVLEDIRGTEGTYAYEGDELYVRAVVTSDRPVADPTRAGECESAWIQPVQVGWTVGR
jgi:hypothetical protein